MRSLGIFWRPDLSSHAVHFAAVGRPLALIGIVWLWHTAVQINRSLHRAFSGWV